MERRRKINKRGRPKINPDRWYIYVKNRRKKRYIYAQKGKICRYLGEESEVLTNMGLSGGRVVKKRIKNKIYYYADKEYIGTGADFLKRYRESQDKILNILAGGEK